MRFDYQFVLFILLHFFFELIKMYQIQNDYFNCILNSQNECVFYIANFIYYFSDTKPEVERRKQNKIQVPAKGKFILLTTRFQYVY